jgi:hypothetical protein
MHTCREAESLCGRVLERKIAMDVELIHTYIYTFIHTYIYTFIHTYREAESLCGRVLERKIATDAEPSSVARTQRQLGGILDDLGRYV